MRILYADDSDPTAMEAMLGAEGFKVHSTDEADEAVDLGKLYDYDLLLLGDVLGQHSVIQRLRSARCVLPIIRFAKAPDAVGAATAALSAGADDYVSRSIGSAELIARIHAVVRRSKGHAKSQITVGPLTVDLDTKTVSVSGLPVHLTGKEYGMLELMALRKGTTLTKEMFLNHLYGGMDEPELKIIDVFICKLRKKLGDASGLVQTVWGRGYVLRPIEPELPLVASPSLVPNAEPVA